MINCRVRLDKGGYVPGESIGLKATINNQSRVAIKKTKAILTETIQYTAKNKVHFNITNTELYLCKISINIVSKISLAESMRSSM